MSLVTSVVAMLILFASCSKECQCFVTTDYYIANNTDKELLYECDYDPWSMYTICQGIVIDYYYSGDSTFCNGIHVYHENKRNRVCNKMWIPLPPESEGYKYFTDQYDPVIDFLTKKPLCSEQKMREAYRRVLYNIADTTSIELPVIIANDANLNITAEYRDGSDSVHWTYLFTVTDSLLSLMRKDTSMLRLFPEYYAK